MRRYINRIYNLSVFATVGFVGFCAGKYHEKFNLNQKTTYFSVLAKSVIVADDTISLDASQDVKNAKNVENKTARISQIMKYGFPSLDNIRSLNDFVLSYDKRNKIPNWVIEHLTAETVKYNEKVDRSKCEFQEDKSIHPYFRAQNSDYKGSGYDRGHMAAAGNHKQNQYSCEQTFLLSNIAPQVGRGFNRDTWNRLEKYTRKLVKQYPNVYVCTGPLYLPSVEEDGLTYVKYRVIGNNTVAVPTHFFKVILMEGADHSLQVEAYVMPNQPISDHKPLTTFRVPLESIERASGLLIFDRLPKENLKSINGRKTLIT